MKVRFQKLDPDAVMPTKAHASDAGYDLVATSIKFDDTNDIVSYGFGIAVEIPQGHVGYIFPRSSVYKTGLSLTNCVGVVDSGYRGEISAKFSGAYLNDKVYRVGDRIAQLIIMPIPEIEFEEADVLSDSDRGANGYGSTGN